MTVVVYGATGRTGRMLARHVGARREVTLCGRDNNALAALAAELDTVPSTRTARCESSEELMRAFEGARAVVQCAPLSAGDAARVAGCSVANGSAYIDVCADPAVASAICEANERDARNRGTALCPGVAPIGGGLGEWLAIAALQRMCGDDSVPEAITLSHCGGGLPWSLGNMLSAIRLTGTAREWSTRVIAFPEPFGRELAFSFPFGAGQLHRYFPRASIETWAALSTPLIASRACVAGLAAIRALAQRDPAAIDRLVAPTILRSLPGEISPRFSAAEDLAFSVSATVEVERRSSSIAAVGRAPYSITIAMVELVLDALERAPDGTFAGPVGVAEMVDAEAALEALAAHAGLSLWTSDAHGDRGRPVVVEDPHQ